MGTLALTTYVLIWPALVAIVLAVLAKAFFADWIEARREGRPMI
ncbi:putative transporter small subunit [Brevundimonas vesicularis]